ncbi:MAG: pyridoxal phosphate-dependent aminotransferase [Actinomycetota bacterium]|nr:pyridoxal phosphate-dependent aminotransferase [Actinomycetota bacterium]
MELTDRMGRLGTESAFEVLGRARQLEKEGRKVVHLEIGEPDFATPAHIVEAAEAALRDGHTGYSAAEGIAELREAVAAFFSRTRGTSYGADRIVITPGAKPVMLYTILATCDEGDEVLYPDPGFPMYESLSAFAGARPIAFPLREERGFRVDPEELASLVTDNTRMVILNSPHNPCGSTIPAEDLDRIAEALAGRDLYVLTDEMYWAIRYGGQHATIATRDGMADRTILLDGCSKTFAMTGWRLGFAALPAELVEPVTKLIINSVSCTATFVQKAAVAALEGPWEPIETMVREFHLRRDAIVEGLERLPGISCTEPEGAFYAFPNVRSLGGSAKDLARYLLEEAGVAALWGTAFGPGGEGHLRLSYANSIENIQAALEAVEAALPGYPGG